MKHGSISLQSAVTDPVLGESPTPDTRPIMTVSQDDEPEGRNDRSCEQQRENTVNRPPIEQANDRASERANNQAIRVVNRAIGRANRVTEQAVSASVVSSDEAADISSAANQQACDQLGIENHDDQTLAIGVLTAVCSVVEPQHYGHNSACAGGLLSSKHASMVRVGQ